MKLPKLGALKLKWSRPIEGVPKRMAVSKDPCGRYFISMACEAEDRPRCLYKRALSAWMGALTFGGWKSGAPKYTYRYARRLKMAQRRLKQPQRVARIKDSRRDFLHPLSFRLINENQVICLEDVNIKEMVRNRRLSKAVADSGLYELHRQFEYKAVWSWPGYFYRGPLCAHQQNLQ